MYKPFDTEIQSLAGKIQHHMSHQYKNGSDWARNYYRLRDEYRKVSKFPILEISQSVWDSMNHLAEQALIN